MKALCSPDLVLLGLGGRESEGDGRSDEVAGAEPLQNAWDSVLVQPDPATEGVEDDAQDEEFDGTLKRRKQDTDFDEMLKKGKVLDEQLE